MSMQWHRQDAILLTTFMRQASYVVSTGPLPIIPHNALMVYERYEAVIALQAVALVPVLEHVL